MTNEEPRSLFFFYIFAFRLLKPKKGNIVHQRRNPETTGTNKRFLIGSREQPIRAFASYRGQENSKRGPSC